MAKDNFRKRPFEIAPPDPGLKPGGIRMRALGSPEIIRRVEIEMRRREGERQKRDFKCRERPA
jgi:hypothetical protein